MSNATRMLGGWGWVAALPPALAGGVLQAIAFFTMAENKAGTSAPAT